ncbi:MAG: hypothetical protein EPO21_01105 [Chloroflexota bacterium]|nr:MAG: hypothetical protein EPO21_01105 [Chloroflexota bacterium]
MLGHSLSGRMRCGALALLLLSMLVLGVPPSTSEAGQGVWTKLGLTGQRVQSVAVDPINPDVLFAGTNGDGILRSTDRGQSWGDINNGLGNLFVNTIAIDPSDSRNVLAATGRGVAVGDASAGIYRSTRRGTTWTLRSTGFASAFAFDPTNPNVVYAGGAPAVRKSTDGGITWSLSFPADSAIASLDVTGVAVDPHNPGNVLAVGNVEGGTGQVFRSTDAGATWTLVMSELEPIFDVVFTRPVTPGPSVAYLAGYAGILRSTDGGVTFSLVTEELGRVRVRKVLINCHNSNVVLGAAEGMGILRSTDLGKTWTVLDGTLGNRDIFGLAIDTASPQSLYAGTADGLWSFTFTALPVLTLSPRSGPPGTMVQFVGSGFTPGGQVTVLVACGLGTVVAEARADLNGGIAGSFAVPNQGQAAEFHYGFVTIFALDRDTGRETPSAIFLLNKSTAAVTTSFFAEGASTPPFETWFLVHNPGPNAANLTFTFELLGGGTVDRTFSAGPHSRFSLLANQVLPNQSFSTRLDSDQPVFVERAMYVSFDGDIVPQIPSAAREWLFAEGATVAPFHTWLLLQNPNERSATATITYVLEGGGTQSQVVDLPANSRTSVFVNEILPDAAFSSWVESDMPIIVERAMYRFPDNAATADAGVQTAARRWFFAEGATTISPFGRNLPTDTWLLLQNPSMAPASVTITLYDTAGNTQSFRQTVAPLSRLNVYLNQLTEFSSFGLRVEASAPVIAERSMFFGAEPRGATTAFGAPGLATEWNFAEGSTAPPFAELISVLNPSGGEMGVTMEFFLEDGQIITRQFTVGPSRKFSVDVSTIVPNSANSARVTTTAPSVVERAMYVLKGRNTGGHTAVGIR